VTKNHTAVKAHVEMGYVMPIRPATAANQIVATHTSAENATAEGTEPIIANDANVLARQKNGVTDTATTISVINIGKSEITTDTAEPKTILFVGSGGGEDEQRKTGIRPDGFCNGSFLARRPLGAC
jgi:hypothetical protein